MLTSKNYPKAVEMKKVYRGEHPYDNGTTNYDKGRTYYRNAFESNFGLDFDVFEDAILPAVEAGETVPNQIKVIRFTYDEDTADLDTLNEVGFAKDGNGFVAAFDDDQFREKQVFLAENGCSILKSETVYVQLSGVEPATGRTAQKSGEGSTPVIPEEASGDETLDGSEALTNTGTPGGGNDDDTLSGGNED